MTSEEKVGQALERARFHLGRARRLIEFLRYLRAKERTGYVPAPSMKQRVLA